MGTINKISFFLCLGFLVTIFLAQFDSWTHEKIIQLCQTIARQSLGCNAQFSIESLNVFSPSLVLTDVEMIALDATWSWKCKRCEINSSWIELLLKGIMNKYIIVENYECTTIVKNNVCAIEPHINALTAESLIPIPSDVKSLIFKNSSVSFFDEQNKSSVTLFFNSSSLKIAQRFRTMMSIYDGFLQYNTKKYAEAFIGDILLTTWHDNNNEFSYTMNGSGLLHIPHMLDENTCYISGTLESGRGRFSIRNAYNSFIIDPIIITEREIRMQSTIPLRYIISCLELEDTVKLEDGTISSFVRIDKKQEHIDGNIIMQNIIVSESYKCDVAKILFSQRDQQWKFRLHSSRQNEECEGVGYWNEITEQGHFEFHNNTQLSSKIVPYWRILPKNLVCHMWINRNESIGIYKINSTNILNKSEHSLLGGFSYKKDDFLVINGLLDNNEFSTKVFTHPAIVLDECSFFDKDKKTLISLQKKDQEYIQGYILFSFIRNFINTFFHYDIQGEGSLLVHGNVSLDDISLDVILDNATIRLPETYNFIDGLCAHLHYDVLKKIVTLQNMNISLHTGTINCLYATVFFNAQGKMIFAQAPLLVDKCLFNIKKDLFAIISGNLLFLHNMNHASTVSGNIIIDRAQLKENIFSRVIQKQLFAYPHSVFSLSDTPLLCDLMVETKSPIRVDTPFLQTNAKVNLRIQNNIFEPKVSGAITLQSGNLIFPYKPLCINKGVLTFTPEQYLDPEIELIARNKIKNYDVSLQVAGSLLNHHIMLDSKPPLSEEQIITLLLVGSHESSLNNMIPALIVQNLKNLIFNNNQSTFLEKYFAPLLRPFSINLIPSFADQTGRGGLRGMLEISINDRWKAMIQKNFSLTEDTRIELEFLMSDDITLRAIRDERRDLGGEVEMRWKF